MTTTTPNYCTHAGCRTSAPCRIELADTLSGAVILRAGELRLGDVVVDEHGHRKFAAFDVELGDPVQVWPAQRDRDAGWPDVMRFLPTDTLLVVRR